MAKSGPKGKQFERRIAQLMRTIYDPPELVAELGRLAAEKQRKERSALIKSSAVRRSDQGKGAVEPDVVVAGCPCWIECQDAGTTKYRPLWKYEQACRDVEQTDSVGHLWPVAICHLTGSPYTGVWIAFHHLVLLSNIQPIKGIDGEPGPLNLHSKGFDMDKPVQIDLEDFLRLLRDDHQRRQGDEDRMALLQTNAAKRR
jgi:hypothetical protein